MLHTIFLPTTDMCYYLKLPGSLEGDHLPRGVRGQRTRYLICLNCTGVVSVRISAAEASVCLFYGMYSSIRCTLEYVVSDDLMFDNVCTWVSFVIRLGVQQFYQKYSGATRLLPTKDRRKGNYADE